MIKKSIPYRIYSFEHMEAPVIFYGHGRSIEEAFRDLIQLLNAPVSKNATVAVKERREFLIRKRVINPNERNNFHRSLWKVKCLLIGASNRDYRMLLKEFKRLSNLAELFVMNPS